MGNKQTKDPKSDSGPTPPDPPSSGADSKRDRSDNQCSDSKRARLHQDAEATADPSSSTSSASDRPTAVASRPEATGREDMFPACANCSCCHGYIFSCPCSALAEGKSKCTHCRDRFSPGATSRSTVAAAASAVDAPMMPTMSRSPSVQGEGSASRHEWSVRVHPTVSGLPPQLIKVLVVPIVIKVLAVDDEGRSLSWPDRGWGQQSHFEMEMEAAFSRDDVETNGVIIARNLTRHEATYICQKLADTSLRASMIQDRAPRLASGVGHPPDRDHLNVAEETTAVPTLSSLPGLEGEEVAAEERVFHVALYLREDAPSPDASNFEAYANSFLESSAPAFLRVLGAPDPAHGHDGAYSWPERGWRTSDQFSSHSNASIQRYGQCIFARKQTFTEAYTVYRRLTAAGFRSAVLLLGHKSSLPGQVPQCSHDHDMQLQDNFPGPPWRLSCDFCRLPVSDEKLYQCRPCDNDYCTLCACIVKEVPALSVLGAGAGARVPFPSQEAGNEALGSSMDDLSNLLRLFLGGVSQNSKPATKQSVIDALQTKRVGEEDIFPELGTSCAICLNEYKNGDRVTQLSCKHSFHVGNHKEEESDATLSCEGILPWLKKNNDCPMCRFQFETEPQAESSGVEVTMGGPWQCPGCNQERTNFSCQRCGIRRNVITVSRGLAAPLFDQVEEIFFACLDLHRRPSHAEVEGASEKQALNRRIAELLESSVMQALVAANWRIKNSVKSLLDAALVGETNFSVRFEEETRDPGSAALYSILVDRIRAKIIERNAEVLVERPDLARLFGRNEWSCPLCDTLNEGEAERCESCGCNFFVLELSKGSDVQEVFREAVQHFFDAMRIVTDIDSSTRGKQSALSALKLKTDALLNSDAVKRLEERQWVIRLPMAYLFAELYAGKKTLSFHVPNRHDTNSCALFAILVRQLIAKQQEEVAAKPQYREITIAPPFVDRHANVDEYEDFSEQVHAVTGNCRGFLLVNKRILMTVAEKLYEGFDDRGWSAIHDVVLPQFARSGWELENAVSLMKLGVRDLQTLTDGLDAGSAAVAEAILRVVLRHESVTVVHGSASALDEIPPLGPPLRRQVSVGTSSKMSMGHLRDRLADDVRYGKVLNFLIKILHQIQADQSNIEHRRINKESDTVIDLVICNPEAISVLQTVGFKEEEHLFRLVRLNRDCIVRTMTVLKELGEAVGLEQV